MAFAIPFGVLAAIGQIGAKVLRSGGSSTQPRRINPIVAAAEATIRNAQKERGVFDPAEQAAARLVIRDNPRFLDPPPPPPPRPPPEKSAEQLRQEREQAETIAALALLDFPVPPPPPPSPQPSSGPPPSGEPVLLPLPPAGPPDVTVDTKEKPVANGFELIPFLSGVANVFGAASQLGSVIRGPVSAPSPMTAGIIAPVISSGVGAMAGSAVSSFLGFGNGNGTPLSRARDADGKRVTRRQVITAARVCGIETAAQSFNLSITDLCTIVSKGMPRRSRGISSTDMKRTRSTLRKMCTMRKTLKPLCR